MSAAEAKKPRKRKAPPEKKAKRAPDHQDYYVYKHVIDGEILYIGYGRGDRCGQTRGRTDRWKKIIGGRPYKIIKEREGLCQSDALELESHLIATHSPIANIQGTARQYLRRYCQRSNKPTARG